jgi:beta-lactamase superfamily II metal-dependent hydrolase
VDSKGEAVLVESSGEYLLMDTGEVTGAAVVKKYLKKYVGTKPLDLYISHMHPDHYGAYKTILKNFHVGTLYVYDGAYLSGSMHEDWVNKVDGIKNYKDRKNTEMAIQYLNYDPAATISNTSPAAIDHFMVGKADVKIMGAVVKNRGEEFDGVNLVNNLSLIARIKGGGMSYLSCGDIQENSTSGGVSDGEEILLGNKYKGKLKSDIMKLSHHGYRLTKGKEGNKISNSDELLIKVKPSISFIIQGNKNDPTEDDTYINSEEANTDNERYRMGETSRRNARKYGFCYPVSHEHKNFVVVCKNKKAELFERKYISSKNKYEDKKLMGLVSLEIKYKKKIGKIWSIKKKIETFFIKSGKRVHNKYINVDGFKYHFNNEGVNDSKKKIPKKKTTKKSKSKTKVNG